MKSYLVAAVYKRQDEIGAEIYCLKCSNEEKGLLYIRRKFYLDFANRELLHLSYTETNFVLSQTVLIPEDQ